MVFVGDSDDDDDEDEVVEYRHIPPEEMIPRSVIAPCMAKILGSSILPWKKEILTTKPRSDEQIADTERKKTSKPIENKKGLESIEKETSRSDMILNVGQGGNTEHKNKHEAESSKTKRGRRRERQKQKKMQSSLSQNDDDTAKSYEKKGKKARSEYFRMHGKLPPP